MVVNVFISAVTTDNLSRKEAVAWVNDTLRSHLTKVEEMSTGAAYCQLTHYLFRDGINLKKVKFNPRNEPEILSNWKILTTSWKALGIDKPVEVEKLKKGKFQDNMEFLQWFFKFFNANLTVEDDYDAVTARNGEDLPALKGRVGAPAPSRPNPVARPAAAPVTTMKPVSTTPRAAAPTTAPIPAAAAQKTSQEPLIKELRDTIKEKEEQVNEWMINAKEMEQERDHYYQLLRKVETLLSDAEESKVTSLDVEMIKVALYGTDDEPETAELQANGAVETAVAQEVEETF